MILYKICRRLAEKIAPKELKEGEWYLSKEIIEKLPEDVKQMILEEEIKMHTDGLRLLIISIIVFIIIVLVRYLI